MRNLPFSIAVVFLLMAGTASALTVDLNTVFNGDNPASSPGYLTADFADTGVDEVTLTLTASLDVASEYIHEVGFNIDAVFTPSNITIAQISGPTVVNFMSGAQDAQSMGGTGILGGGLDFVLEFDNAPPGARFDGTDVAVFTLTGAGISMASFDFTNANDGIIVGAHIHGIVCTPESTSIDCLPGGPGTTSGAVSQVPGPGAAMLIGLGLLGLGWEGRRARQS